MQLLKFEFVLPHYISIKSHSSSGTGTVVLLCVTAVVLSRQNQAFGVLLRFCEYSKSTVLLDPTLLNFLYFSVFQRELDFIFPFNDTGLKPPIMLLTEFISDSLIVV